jgi:cobalt ECF transporter T component CbiQ
MATAATAERPTPTWLTRGEVTMCPCGCIGKRKKGSFVEKTLSGASGLMRQAIFTEDVAFQDGLLQRIDPRVKVLVLLGLLIVASFMRHIPILLGMYVLTLALAFFSALPIGFFIKRVWLFVPIFTGIIVLPATLSIITPGDIVVPLWTWHGSQVGITAQGLTAAGMIVIRVAVSISLVVLLTLTTPWAKLLAALRSLHIPKVFVLIIGMTYRYIFLLLNSVTDMYTSRKSRSAGNAMKDVKEGQRFVSATAGALFGKAHALSEEVHMAMVSRGFTGDAKVLTTFRTAALDWWFTIGAVLVGAIVIWGDRLLGR